jgi:hypothetical protein
MGRKEEIIPVDSCTEIKIKHFAADPDSGSVGSICFCASWIRIRTVNQRSGSFYHLAKILRKTLIPTVL